jgi:hypothetical protein
MARTGLLVTLALVALLGAACGEKRLQLPEGQMNGIYFPDGFESGGSIRIKVSGPDGCSFAVERVDVAGEGAARPDDLVADVEVARDFESTNPCPVHGP